MPFLHGLSSFRISASYKDRVDEVSKSYHGTCRDILPPRHATKTVLSRSPLFLHPNPSLLYTSPHFLHITSPKQSISNQSINQPKMLRRKPTTITLTSEDIAAYDDTRAAERNRLENVKPNKNDGKVDPNDELKPLPGDRPRIRSGLGSGLGREERIVGR